MWLKEENTNHEGRRRTGMVTGRHFVVSMEGKYNVKEII
jgi:hypothetical protein